MQRYQMDLLAGKKNFAVEYLEHNLDTMQFGHCHSHFEIYVQMSGRRRYFLKNHVYEIETGDVVLIAPGLMHKTSNIDKSDYSRLLIEFDEKYLRDLDAFLGGVDLKSYLSQMYTRGYFIYRNKEQTQQVLSTCKKIAEGYTHPTDLGDMTARLQVAEFLLHILHESVAAEHTDEIGSRYKISEILSYISDNYNQDISLKETSERFYLSYYYLSRLFKEVTGFTFVAYVNIVRVNKAKQMIEESDKGIELISEAVGFGSQKQFVRAFKALYGVSPSKYKTMTKQRKKEA